MAMKDVSISSCANATRTKQEGSSCQETSANTNSKHSPAKKEWFGKEDSQYDLVKNKSYECEAPERKQGAWTSQDA